MDISFAMSMVSQFLKKPKMPHWVAVQHMLKLLQRSLGSRLLYKANGHLRIEGYTNVDWAGSSPYRRSTTSYCTFMGVT
jgi:hypothetical protein